VVSPSVWWGNGDIVGRVGAQPKVASRIWLDMGTGEGAEAVSGAQALRDALVQKGWVLGQDLAYVEAPGAAHNEAAWAERVDEILRFLFPAR
jgi:predicted alpha/beta superfamily hydrolase